MDYVGKELAHISFPVERGKIAEYARATGETNPVYFDREEAIKAGFDDVPAPVTFLQIMNHFLPGGPIFPPDFDPKKLVHGECEYEIKRLPVGGETLNASFVFTKVFEKKNKAGSLMRFAIRECKVTDKAGEVVVIRRDVLIET
ncbi:MAG: MaoC family dehydratase [Deltaproteobacteria bacterium]|nr:MaoC family dehydratase [Deltaproteobacteria bacterium]